jgi:hypothetical protein
MLVDFCCPLCLQKFDIFYILHRLLYDPCVHVTNGFVQYLQWEFEKGFRDIDGCICNSGNSEMQWTV